ncbi:MAG: hypothetical protein EBZ77_17100, partial [Chitinophagia bacterium]|nr:hypothetical protein [Chitinophagia bacterium]
IVKNEEEFNRQIREGIKHLDPSLLRTTAVSDTFWYDIPIVIHVIHDFNYSSSSVLDYLSDDYIFDAVKQWNVVYACQNSADTAAVIAPFKKYIGNPRIRLHLATIDPYGNRTKGITRRRSYLTYNGGDQAKYDIWPPTSYVNIWVINTMSAANGRAAAYATPPTTAAAVPYSDGVITLASYFLYDNTINHEIGHIFSLIHPWGNNNSAQCGACEDNGSDEVDDTPPTIGHDPQCGCSITPRIITTQCPANKSTNYTQGCLYDTICAKNYYKIYATVGGTFDSLVDYPDTTNAQNIMDYTYCSKMFTKGQVVRMHAALNSSVAGRNNLWDTLNLRITGAMVPLPDLKPVPEYAVSIGTTTSNQKMQYFTCPGVPLRFTNRTYNDTVTKLK